MKAILQYGQFSTMIELPEPRPEISVVKPTEEQSLLPLEEQYSLDEVKPSRFEFRLDKQMTPDIWLYKFVREL